MVKVGQKVIRTPETIAAPRRIPGAGKSTLEGTVVLVHPKGRYHTVEFLINGIAVRESFQGVAE